MTVLVPTHDHGPLLHRSVASALGQTISDLDVVILGDGVDAITRGVAQELVARDQRVTFLDHPKGPRLGELHRHGWLTHDVTAPVVCYLSDDDLLLPHHAEVALAALDDADFVAPVATWVRVDGSVACEPGDMRREDFRRWLATGPRTTFGLSGVAHTVAAYRRLPHGWRMTPIGTSTDHYMWSQWAEQPWLRAVTLTEPTVVHLPSPPRRDWTPERRVIELDHWAQQISEPTFRVDFRDEAWKGLAETAVNHIIRERWWTLAAAHEEALREDAERWTVDLREAFERARDETHSVRALADEAQAEAGRLRNEVLAREAVIDELVEARADGVARLDMAADEIESLHGHLGRVRAAEMSLRKDLRAMESAPEWRAGQVVRRVARRLSSQLGR